MCWPVAVTLLRAQAYEACITGSGTAIAREDVRLRDYVPSCGRCTHAYTGKDGATLVEAGIAPAKVMILETRVPGKVRALIGFPVDEQACWDAVPCTL